MTLYDDVLYYILLVYNFASLVIGIVAVVACVFELDKFSQNINQYTEDIVQLVAACVLVISAFVGCSGVACNSIYSLGFYLTIMLFLIITHLWKLLRYDETKLEDDIRGEVTYAWVQAVNKHSAAMNKMQQKYECCGLDDTTDTDKGCFSDGKAVQGHGGGCTIAMQKYCLHIYRIEKLVHSIMLGYEITGVVLTSLFSWQLFSKTRRYIY